METNLRFGMLQTVYTGEETIEQIEETVMVDGEEVVRKRQVSHFGMASCKDELCGRPVNHEDPCFIDTWTPKGNVYCDSCGKCMRYERKMADRRGNGEVEALKEEAATK